MSLRIQGSLDRMMFGPDGKMNSHTRASLLSRGCTEKDIADHERFYKERQEFWAIQARIRSNDTLKDRLISRAGLSLEEELSEGYVTIDDLTEANPEAPYDHNTSSFIPIDPDVHPEEEF